MFTERSLKKYKFMLIGRKHGHCCWFSLNVCYELIGFKIVVIFFNNKINKRFKVCHFFLVQDEVKVFES